MSEVILTLPLTRNRDLGQSYSAFLSPQFPICKMSVLLKPHSTMYGALFEMPTMDYHTQ